MIAVLCVAGGVAVRQMWLPNVVGEKLAQKIEMAPHTLMADLFNAAPENEPVAAPEVQPPTETPLFKEPTPETPPTPVVVPEDRIEVIVPTTKIDEPEITLDELLEENADGEALPSSGPRKMPRPSAQN